jgi:hypothetical protein
MANFMSILPTIRPDGFGVLQVKISCDGRRKFTMSNINDIAGTRQVVVVRRRQYSNVKNLTFGEQN